MKKIKYFIGPMSKNVVDTVLKFEKDTDNNIGFIPSRRQVEFNGGYVNNWSTIEFREYAKNSFIVRDHGGPGQGNIDDDGYESLNEDCKGFNMIHVDPWKKYSNYNEGLDKTVEIIKYCYNRNDKILFEVGTEESIRPFSYEEIGRLLKDLRNKLSDNEYNNIKYCVIQSGTSLKENKNTGVYSGDRLGRMLDAVKPYGLLTKEHNGDYLPPNLIKEKFDAGLDSINIAPEFGQIETKTYLKYIKENKPNLLDNFWKVCYDSGRWKKWVTNEFNPEKQKEELINICGHYVLSNPVFISEIKDKCENINDLIQENIENKLKELF